MRLLICFLVTLFTLSSFSCASKAQKDPAVVTSKGISGIDTEGFDITTRAQDDFYQYVNGKWLETTPMPSDKSNYGSFSIVGDQTELQLREIIRDLEKDEIIKVDSDAQKVRDYYGAYVKASENDVFSNELSTELKVIDGIANVADFWKVAGQLSKIDVPNVIGIYIYSDLKNPNTMSVYMSQARQTLGDRDYYLKDDSRFVKGRGLLTTYIDKISEVSKIELPAKEILEFETRVAKIQWPKEKNRDPKQRYNPTSNEDVLKASWSPLLLENGIPSQTTYVISQPSYFQDIGKVIAETKLSTLKAYLTFRLLNSFASLMGRDSFDARFAFSRKGLRGVQTPRPVWKRAINNINWGMGEVLGKVYIERYFKKEANEKMTVMVENLRSAYGVSIDGLEWMGPETKKEAQDKLSKFNPKIAFPKQWKDYSKLTIKPGSAINNAKSISEFDLQRAVAKLGKPVDKTEWGMPPQIVNAYYNGVWNEIVFPAAVLQPPFFNLKADDAVNYGGIGAVIGHEIGHGFDDQGRKFDGDGVLRDWWTSEDAARFDVLKKKLAAQYNAFKVIDGLTINGEFTSGENIGDLGGLSIAYKAYRMSLNGKEAPVIDGMTGDQRFFMGWALVWRRLYTDVELKRRITTDPHSPSKARTNVILSNIDAFYEAFDVKEGDKMYLAPEKRVQIW